MIAKNMRRYAQEKNFVIDTKNKRIYGKMNGFYVVIRQEAYHGKLSHGVYVWAKQSNTIPGQSPLEFMRSRKSHHLANTHYENSIFMATFCPLSHISKGYIASIDAFLKDLTDWLLANDFRVACTSCGTEEQLGFWQVGRGMYLHCPACHEVARQRMEELSLTHTSGQNENMLLGLLGAFLGVLVGAVAWVLIYQIGFIASVTGLIMIVGATKGYEKLAGNLSKKGVILCYILSMVMVFFAQQCCYGIMLSLEYDINILEGFLAVPEALTADKWTRIYFFSELVIGLLLMVCGAFYTVKNRLEDAAGKVNIQLLERL